jgi:predicted permease
LSVLLFGFNAIAPLLFAMLTGWLIARKGHINEENISFLNLLCFRYLLALHIFNSVLSIDFFGEFSPALILVGVSGILGAMLLAWLVFSLTVRDRARRCIFIVSSFRSNNLVFALPLAANLFGRDNIQAAAMLSPVTIILFNLFSVIAMVSHARRPESGMKAALKRAVTDIAHNPLIIGSVLGILFSLLRIRLPGFLRSGVSSVASAASPVSLILLGAQIDIQKLAGNIKPVLGACLLRLVIVPGLLVPLAILAGFRGPELGALLVAFAAPCAVSTLIMARNYGIDPVFAGQTVYLSTVLSLFTIFGAVSTLRALELL